MEFPKKGSNLTGEQRAFNKDMASSCIMVECILKMVKIYFYVLHYKRNVKVSEAPVGSRYLPRMLLCNIRNFIYLNQISRYSKCSLPSLEDYLEPKEWVALLLAPRGAEEERGQSSRMRACDL